jgi:hypothetical protein
MQVCFCRSLDSTKGKRDNSPKRRGKKGDPRVLFFRLLTNRHAMVFSVGRPGGIAQLVERLVRNEKARGSNPLTSSLRFEARKTEVVTPEQRVGGLCFARFLSDSTTTAWQASRLRSSQILTKSNLFGWQSSTSLSLSLPARRKKYRVELFCC